MLWPPQDRSVFPITLCVTKLSGTGQDSIFMGIMREALHTDPSLVKVGSRAERRHLGSSGGCHEAVPKLHYSA